MKSIENYTVLSRHMDEKDPKSRVNKQEKTWSTRPTFQRYLCNTSNFFPLFNKKDCIFSYILYWHDL